MTWRRRHLWPRAKRNRAGRSPRGAGGFREMRVEALEPRVLLAVDFDLAEILNGDGSDGFALAGSVDLESAGRSVSGVGDVNGDGFDDVIVGTSPNVSHVIFGKAGGFAAVVDLNSLNGTNGFSLQGGSPADDTGFSVSGAGDFNGDGIDDLLVGAPQADANGDPKAGQAYLVFGTRGGFDHPLNLAGLDGQDGFAILGVGAGDIAGWSLSEAGDFNGDGLDDVIVGAPHVGPGAGNAGQAYLLYGRTGSVPGGIDLALLQPADGFAVLGASDGDVTGFSVAGGGDINGDGLDDLVVSAPRADLGEDAAVGKTYVIFGRRVGIGNLLQVSSLDGTTGFVIQGTDADSLSGSSVSLGGDVNGDGFDDLVVGAPYASPRGAIYAGQTFVVFGRNVFPATVRLDLLNGTDGFVLNGAAANDLLGQSVAAAGDVNGDGFDDLIIGASQANPLGRQNAGKSYLVFGKAGPFAASMDVTSLGDGDALVLQGALAGERAGSSVRAAGDVNGDGFDDIVLGAPYASVNAIFNGRSFVVLGGDFTGRVTHPGTPGNDTLTGKPAANVMIGGQGSDTLLGRGGADVLRGGEGNDILAVTDLTFRRIVGGHGNDVLRLDAAGVTLDLSNIPDNRLTGIEAIDITGTGNNTLVLREQEVLNASDETNELLVGGNANDVLKLASTFTLSQTVGSLDVYTSGRARVVVPRIVTVQFLTRQVRLETTLGYQPTGFSQPATGEVLSVPSNVALLDEWRTVWAEVWVYNSAFDGVGVKSASVDLSFNADLYTVVAVEFAGAFAADGQPVIDDEAGTITGISGATTRADVGDDRPALLARVRLQPTSADVGLEHNANGQYLTPNATAEIAVSNPEAVTSDDAIVVPDLVPPPVLAVWPVMYDIDDDHRVGFSDFAYFASAFLSAVGAPGREYAFASDFDRSGTVNFGDFSYFAANFGRARAGAGAVVYPPNFPSAWLGGGLRVVSSGSPAPDAPPTPLTDKSLAPVADAAIRRTGFLGGDTDSSDLAGVAIEIVDLPGNLLGWATPDRIQIDVDAAGHGWFIDSTPYDDGEFTWLSHAYPLLASAGSPATGRVDLLTVIMHELGHVAGYVDEEGDELMGGLLTPGTRRLPALDLAFAEGV